VIDDQQRLDAVERAYRDHADDVYRVAYAILRDPDGAMDATHDAFAQAFRRWEQYDANRPLRPWLHGIVSHLALDALRRRRVRVKALDAIGRVQSVSPILDPGTDDMVRRLTERDLVEDALGNLKPDVRAALVLRHYYGYDYAEIATLLRTSPGNVGSILSRAHRTLRERLTAVSPSATVDDDLARGAVR
jgi:RNA polymerase sigma-70 factor (ECF subfamily)